MPLREVIQDAGFLGSLAAYVLVTLLALFVGNTENILPPSSAFEVATELLFALILLYVIVSIIRLFYFKKRPDSQKFSGFLTKIDASSFPSMHAARSTVLASVVWQLFSFSWSAGIILGLFVLLTGFSRVYGKRHYWSDVIAGWIIGGIVLALTRWVILSSLV